MIRSSASNVSLVVARGFVKALSWVLLALGAILETTSHPTSSRSDPRRRAGDLDEDGHLVKDGSTDLLL